MKVARCSPLVHKASVALVYAAVLAGIGVAAWTLPGDRLYIAVAGFSFWAGGLRRVFLRRQKVNDWGRLFPQWWRSQRQTRAVIARSVEQLAAIGAAGSFLAWGLDSSWNLGVWAALVVAEAALLQKAFWIFAGPGLAVVAGVSAQLVWRFLWTLPLWVIIGYTAMIIFILALVVEEPLGQYWSSLRFRRQLRKAAYSDVVKKPT